MAMRITYHRIRGRAGFIRGRALRSCGRRCRALGASRENREHQPPSDQPPSVLSSMLGKLPRRVLVVPASTLTRRAQPGRIAGKRPPLPSSAQCGPLERSWPSREISSARPPSPPSSTWWLLGLLAGLPAAHLIFARLNDRRSGAATRARVALVPTGCCGDAPLPPASPGDMLAADDGVHGALLGGDELGVSTGSAEPGRS